MGKFLRRHFGRMRRIRQARARNALQNSGPHYKPELVELEQIRREDAAWTPTARKPRGAAVVDGAGDGAGVGRMHDAPSLDTCVPFLQTLQRRAPAGLQLFAGHLLHDG